MDENLKNAVVEQITKSDNIAIVVSKALGFDGLAAGLALYLSLIKLDKNVSILAQSPTVGDAQSLYGVDKVGSGKGIKTPVIVVQNAIETVDRVTHFLDKDNLKLVLHPLPGAAEITKDQISVEYTTSPANLIFALGIDNLPDLRSEVTHEQQINPEALIININNIEPAQKFAQIDIIDPQAAGLSEVTAKTLQGLALPVDEDIAFNLYSGMQKSTNNFSPGLVSPVSFEVASWLLKFGAGKASLARNQVGQVTPINPAPTKPAAPQAAKPKQTFSAQEIMEAMVKRQQQPAPQPQRQIPADQPWEDTASAQDEDFFETMPAIEEVEAKENTGAVKSNDWLKPPKIYKGSESPGESKG